MAHGQEPSLSDVDAGDEPGAVPLETTLAGELEGLFRFAAARAGPLAEDATQQALLIAMAHRSPPCDPPCQRAWVRGILLNVIRRLHRSARRQSSLVVRSAHESHASGPRAADADDSERGRLVQALHLAVTELDQADQDLFHSFYRAGRSHASIAEELATTPKGVEARLYRLRSRLRAALHSSGEHVP